jgi:chromate transporter
VKWVTKARPKIDRVACPWLVTRFVDPHAEFLFVPADQVMAIAQREGAIPFDVPGVELGHHGTECSLDAFIKKYDLSDPALERLATIVRGADTAARDLTPESPGLAAIAEGFRLLHTDDHALLQEQLSVYDALHAWCRASIVVSPVHDGLADPSPAGSSLPSDATSSLVEPSAAADGPSDGRTRAEAHAPPGTANPAASEAPVSVGVWPLTAYFLKLGSIGFGGVALLGFMHRDLVERRRWVTEEVYKLALALAQLMPGPLAVQLAIALGYFQHGLLGATAVGLAFVLPSFLLVVALAMAYVAYEGLWWVQAVFYAVGAAVIAIIALSACRLAGSVNKRDPLLWGLFGVLAIATVWTQAGLAALIVLAGLLVLVVEAPPQWLKARVPFLGVAWPLPLLALQRAPAPLLQMAPATVEPAGDLLLQILLFFTKTGIFVYGSGLAILPVLHQGVVQDFGWLNERQFVDAVAVAMITPGPVVITVAFIGYLVAGLPGATLAAIGIFLPAYFLTIVPAAWFKRHRDNAQLKAFVRGATAATTGAIIGTLVLVSQRSIVDLPTVAIALVSLGLLWRYKLPEPIVVLAAGAVGLVLWPLVQPAG